MMFRVGQKVVCVDDRPTDMLGGRDLSWGTVYTIRWVGLWGQPWWKDRLCVRLVGIDRGVDDWQPLAVDIPFIASRFRPIQERKTDIGWAHEILRKATKKKRAPAFPSPAWHGG